MLHIQSQSFYYLEFNNLMRFHNKINKFSNSYFEIEFHTLINIKRIILSF
jgi:hypothetical protein